MSYEGGAGVTDRGFHWQGYQQEYCSASGNFIANFVIEENTIF